MLQARNAVRVAKAEATGAGLRGIIGGFANQALKVDERQAERQAAEAARQARRARVAEQEQMRAVADEALLHACTDEDGTVDAALLEARLREAGKWPPSRAHPPADAHEESSAPDPEAITSMGMPSWWAEDKVAEALGIRLY